MRYTATIKSINANGMWETTCYTIDEEKYTKFEDIANKMKRYFEIENKIKMFPQALVSITVGYKNYSKKFAF